MAIQLYALDGCPWCEKVSDALDEAGVAYETEGSTRSTPTAVR